MSRKLWLVLLIFIVWSKCLLAQDDLIRGTVRDTAHREIHTGSIILKYLRNQTNLISYQTLDSTGRFFFRIPIGSKIISMQCIVLGYVTQIKYFENDIPNLVNFVMVQSERLLETVNIHAKQPILIKGDTTTIDVDSFAKKNEQTVEDLLKRLPGMNVDQDGNISFNGKPVERVLVDGDDLFNTDFKLLTKNLSADVIDKAQVIQKYNDNQLLSGLNKSDKQVLNLKLKDDRKNNINGNFDLAYGIPNHRSDNRLNLISIFPKTKAILLTGTNNIGNSPFSVVGLEKHVSKYNTSNGDHINLNEPNPIVTIAPLVNKEIELNRNNFNQSEVGSINFMSKITKTLEVNAMLYWVSDFNRQSQVNNITYLRPNNNHLSIFQNQDISQTKRFLGYNVELLQRINKISQLKITSKGSSMNQKLGGSLNLADGAIEQMLQSQNRITQNTVNYTIRINSNAAFDIEGLSNKIKLPQLLNINPYGYNSVLESPVLPNRNIQQSSINLGQTGVRARALFKYDLHSLIFSTGFNRTTHILDYNFYVSSDHGIADTLFSKTSMQTNKKSLQYVDALYNFQITGNLSLMANTSYNVGSQNLSNFTPTNHNFRYFEHKFGTTYDLKEDGNINLQYNYRKTLPGFAEVINFPLLSDYRTFQEGSNQFSMTSGNSVNLNYSLADYQKRKLLFVVGVNYENNASNYLTNIIANEDFTINRKVAANDYTSLYLGFCRIEKFIPTFGGNITFEGHYLQSHYPSLVNGIRNNVDLSVGSFKLGFKSGWVTWFNLELNTMPKVNRFKGNFQNVTTEAKNNGWENTLKLYLIPNDKLSFEVSALQYIFSNVGSGNNLAFIDMKIRFQPEKSRWKFSFTGKNLLNRTQIDYLKISTNQVNMQSFNLVPRFFMLGIYRTFTIR